MTSRILVVGATGFIGVAVAQALAARGSSLRWTEHVRPLPAGIVRAGDEMRRIDLTDSKSVDGLTRGVDAVIHLGSRISGTSEQLRAVNVDGCRALIDDCVSHGVRRVVRLSTAAVYGPGPWTDQSIHRLSVAPASETSRTRLAGDDLVLAAGGLVVRPHLVWGLGDRWVTPRAVDITRKVGWIDEGRARHSAIHVVQLAERLATLALEGLVDAEGRPRVVLASDQTVRMRDFVRRELTRMHLPEPTSVVTLSDVLDHPAGKGDPRWRHDVLLFGRDYVLCDDQSPAVPGGADFGPATSGATDPGVTQV